MFGKITPRDDYQIAALDSLMHNQISMLRRPGGSGKTLLSFGYMFHLLERGKIDKIIVFCNTIATKGSAKLGYYPGTRTEKLLDSQIGNLLESKLGDRIAVENLIERGQLILLPLSDIRGYDTTGMNAAIYISEAQNLDIEMLKLALQRIGEDAICIIDGDFETQTDLSIYDGTNNGMRRASQVFRGEEVYGEVRLKNIYRSKIADIANRM
jgi:predicted ribonuclease YlaK